MNKKINLLIWSLFVFTGLNVNAGSDNKQIRLKQLVTPSFYNGVIHQSDLSTSVGSGSGMFTINKPGRYYVAGDLSLAPANNQVIGIKIATNNVLLNLNSSMIYQRTGNAQTGLIGIQVDSNVSNVRICNGTINGLNGSSAADFMGGVVIVRSGAYDVTIEDVVVSNCTSSMEELSGFLLDTCIDVKLINCESINNSNTNPSASGTNGNVAGFRLNATSDCLLQNCLASRNVSTDQNSYGIRLADGCVYNQVLNCRALNQASNSVNATSCAGFIILDGIGNLVDGCIAIGNTGGTNVASIGAGFLLGGAEENTILQNCLAQSNSGGTGDGFGIRVDSGVVNSCVQNCRFFSNTGAANGIGVYDGGASSVMYVSNFAHGNRIPGSTVDNYSGTVGEISTATHASYTNLDATRAGYNNLEIVG